MQAEHAGDERDHHHGHHQFRTYRAEGVGEDGGNRVGVFAGDHLLHVRHGEDQRQAGEHGGGAADVDGHAHGLGNALAGIGGFLGDVTAGLEAVVLEQAGQGGGEEGRQVGAVDVEVEGVEQHAERLMTFEQQQVTAHQDGAHQLAEEAEHGHPGEQLGAHQVECRGQQDQAEGDVDVGIGVRLEAEHGGEVGTRAHGDAGDGGAERPGVDPAHHPRPALADQATGPGIDAAGDGELRNHFTEHQAHQQLAEADQQVGPEHRRAACRKAEAEQGVDAHHGRQVGEAEGEVFPQAHAAFEVGAVAERLELLGVLIDRSVCTRSR
ncbi:hypothetical protein D3C84_581780 [compost metagenome]